MSAPTLTQRAEQALIGALLAHPWQFIVFGEATGDAFTDPRLARVYDAMTVHWGRIAPDDIDRPLEPIASTAGVVPDYLEFLRSACPAPLHAGAYDRLVAEAAIRRDLRSTIDELTDKARKVGYGPLSAHSLKVADALKHHLIAFDPDTMTAVLTQPLNAQNGQHAPVEESVLAGLLNQHRQSRTTLEILHPEAWTDPARQELHQAMVTLVASGRDIDPLTVDWQISHAREQNGQPAGHPVAEDAGPSYATKLAGIPVTGNLLHRAYALMDAARAARPEPGGPSAGIGPQPPRVHGAGPAPAQDPQPGLLEIPPPAPGNGHVPGPKM